jgi:tripartite-type tricarboxylate transporter receptor subunit TctC
MTGRRRLIQAAAALAAGGAAPAVAADPFPQRPIRLVVPLAPGGTTDLVARLLAERAGGHLGQPVVVENRPGAGGTIGSDLVARAAPDGHTILMGTIGTVAVAPALYATLPYDPDRAFAPVILASTSQFVVVARSSLAVEDLRGLLALAGQNPGRLNYASAGNGSTLHLGMELLNGMAGVTMQHVPYRSSGEVVTALASGQVDLGMPDISSVLPQLREGRLRALAVTGARRAEVLPGVPTVAESGFPGFDVGVWLGLLAPAGTPAPVVARLHEAFARALRAPETMERLRALDTEVVASTPEAFAEFIRAERTRWANAARQAGIRLQ